MQTTLRTLADLVRRRRWEAAQAGDHRPGEPDGRVRGAGPPRVSGEGTPGPDGAVDSSVLRHPGAAARSGCGRRPTSSTPRSSTPTSRWRTTRAPAAPTPPGTAARHPAAAAGAPVEIRAGMLLRDTTAAGPRKVCEYAVLIAVVGYLFAMFLAGSPWPFGAGRPCPVREHRRRRRADQRPAAGARLPLHPARPSRPALHLRPAARAAAGGGERVHRRGRDRGRDGRQRPRRRDGCSSRSRRWSSSRLRRRCCCCTGGARGVTRRSWCGWAPRTGSHGADVGRVRADARFFSVLGGAPVNRRRTRGGTVEPSATAHELADLARAGYRVLHEPSMQVEFEIHHLVDRPGGLAGIVARDPTGHGFAETLSAGANGVGLVVGTRIADAPGRAHRQAGASVRLDGRQRRARDVPRRPSGRTSPSSTSPPSSSTGSSRSRTSRSGCCCGTGWSSSTRFGTSPRRRCTPPTRPCSACSARPSSRRPTPSRSPPTWAAGGWTRRGRPRSRSGSGSRWTGPGPTSGSRSRTGSPATARTEASGSGSATPARVTGPGTGSWSIRTTGSWPGRGTGATPTCTGPATPPTAACPSRSSARRARARRTRSCPSWGSTRRSACWPAR